MALSFHQLFRPGKKVVGVELCLLPSGEKQMRTVVLAREKNIVTLQAGSAVHADVSSLQKGLDQNTPMVLAITGKGILTRKIEPGLQKEPAEKVIAHALPNAKASDFYLQRYIGQQATYASLIRRDRLDALLDEFKGLSVPVIHVSLGPFVVANVAFLLPGPAAVLTLEGYQLIFAGHDLTDCTPGGEPGEGQTVQLGDDVLPTTQMVAYAAAWTGLFGFYDSLDLPVEQVRQWQQDFKHKEKFKAIGVGMLATAFLLLAANALFFVCFSAQHQDLSFRHRHYKGTLVKLDSLQAELSASQTFFARTGWMGSARTSYYTDKIASTVPYSITLQELTMHPLDEAQYKKDKTMLFQPNAIFVKGVCSHPSELNPWVKQVKTSLRAKSVIIQDYHYDAKEQAGTFLITIMTQ